MTPCKIRPETPRETMKWNLRWLRFDREMMERRADMRRNVLGEQMDALALQEDR